jgi:virginiamycin B lyase
MTGHQACVKAAIPGDRSPAILDRPAATHASQPGRASGNKMRATVPRVRAIRVVVFVVAVAALWLPASAGAYVYWANYNPQHGTTVGRANLDGTGADQTFITAATDSIGIAVDDNHVYWTNAFAGTIGRANLNGTGVNQFFITGINLPEGVAVDSKHVYWTTEDGAADSIGRANLDGSAPENNFITGADNPGAVVVDGQHIYWTNPSASSIGRADLDGKSVDQSFIDLSGTAGPGGVAVDGRHIYWTSERPGLIGRANLDGSAVNKSFIPTGDAVPFGVAVDAGRVYWANEVVGTVGRANLDGSSPDPNFITGRFNVAAVAVDSLPYPTTTSVACSPAALTLPASTSCTATVTDTAALSAPTGTVAFSSTGLGSFGSPPSCSLVAGEAAQSACQLTFTPSLAGAQTITAAYLGDVMHAANSGTAAFTVLAPPSSFVPPPVKPSNLFALSGLKLNRRNGSAALIATVPGAGTLLLTGRAVKRLTRLVSHAGTVRLTIKGQPGIQRRLGRTGKATVTVKVTYTPTGGDPNTESNKVTLRRGRR